MTAGHVDAQVVLVTQQACMYHLQAFLEKGP